MQPSRDLLDLQQQISVHCPLHVLRHTSSSLHVGAQNYTGRAVYFDKLGLEPRFLIFQRGERRLCQQVEQYVAFAPPSMRKENFGQIKALKARIMDY
jgi:hypothetical protein